MGLQLASSQLSPRVIRTFVRSGVTKLAFGFFLATFAFAVTGLAMDEVVDPSAAARTVMVSMAMLAGAVVIFVIYVTATMRLLEVGWVITAVANEARAAIRRGYPRAEAYVEADPPVLVAHPHVVHLSSRDTRSYKGVLGTVLGIDRPRLVRLATTYDCVIEILPRVGEYVVTGGPVLAVHGDRAPPDADLLTCIDLGRARTLYQDPTFGIRQLVDVATQALSPAINQPTTAVLVIDRLHDLLLRIARLPTPAGSMSTRRARSGWWSRRTPGTTCCTWRSSRSPPWGSRRHTSPGVWPPRSGICRPTCPAERPGRWRGSRRLSTSCCGSTSRSGSRDSPAPPTASDWADRTATWIFSPASRRCSSWQRCRRRRRSSPSSCPASGSRSSSC